MFMICTGISLWYREADYIYFVYAALINVAVGSLFNFSGRKASNVVTRRDGYCIVAFTWLLFTAFGMLPFYISGEIPSVTDAFFETMSGLTTTGATILDNIADRSSLYVVLEKFYAVGRWIGYRVLYHCGASYFRCG